MQITNNILQNLYDNRNLQSFKAKKRRKQAEQKNSNFDQHIDDIDSGVKALDDIQIVSNNGGDAVIFSNPSARVS